MKDNPIKPDNYSAYQEGASLVDIIRDNATPLESGNTGNMKSIAEKARKLWDESPYGDMPQAYLDFY